MSSGGSLPVLHYLNIGRLGRGEVIRLFLRDNGIDFKDVRMKYDDTWPANSKKLQEQGLSKTGQVPVLEYNGKILRQHLSILRYLSREIGSHEGDTSFEKYIVDAVADVHNDWRVQWVANLGKVTDEYKNEFVPKYYRILDDYYSERGGPYLLGDKITYADYAVYQSIDNDQRTGTLPATLPGSLKKLVEAVEARPNIAAYIKEGKTA
ncbi:glutathione S-transferase [Mariannaea sp. PMI_226]|nr:glutathione S-transferase [Mariannaea sp. PMI_226]